MTLGQGNLTYSRPLAAMFDQNLESAPLQDKPMLCDHIVLLK